VCCVYKRAAIAADGIQVKNKIQENECFKHVVLKCLIPKVHRRSLARRSRLCPCHLSGLGQHWDVTSGRSDRARMQLMHQRQICTERRAEIGPRAADLFLHRSTRCPGRSLSTSRRVRQTPDENGGNRLGPGTQATQFYPRPPSTSNIFLPLDPAEGLPFAGSPDVPLLSKIPGSAPMDFSRGTAPDPVGGERAS